MHQCSSYCVGMLVALHSLYNIPLNMYSFLLPLIFVGIYIESIVIVQKIDFDILCVHSATGQTDCPSPSAIPTYNLDIDSLLPCAEAFILNF